jgi:hypothetical protein
MPCLLFFFFCLQFCAEKVMHVCKVSLDLQPIQMGSIQNLLQLVINSANCHGKSTVIYEYY